MAISQNFPEEGPTLNLNFAGSKVLDPRITFSRSSVGTYMDANGLVSTASTDSPRFDHRYVNGEIESLGLLVEESRTNLIKYSNDFSQSNWTKQNSHPTPSKNAIGPDGVANSASTVYRTATNQYLHQQIVGGGTYTLSVWVKSEAATGSFLMQAYNGTDGATGQVTHTATNEWQRFETTMSPTTTSTYYPCVPTNTNTNFYVWGVQVESGSFKTSYIPTEGSTKTRSPDNVSMTGTNFSDWFNSSEGTLVTQSSMSSDRTYSGTFRARAQIIKSSSYNTDSIFQYVNSSGLNATSIKVSNSSIFGITSGSYSIGTKIASAYSVGSYAVSAKGLTPTTNSYSGIPSGLDKLIIGNVGDNNKLGCINGHISQLTYYPTRLSNTALQNLTK